MATKKVTKKNAKVEKINLNPKPTKVVIVKKVEPKTTKVTVKLIQEKGQIEFSKEVHSDKWGEISGTIVQNILTFYDKVKKYKIKLDGFSFSRKFRVVVSIENNSITQSELFGVTSNAFDITMNNKLTFVEFTHDLVGELLCTDNITIPMNEVKDTLLN